MKTLIIQSFLTLIPCLLSFSASALDVQTITQQLGSDDYEARQNARLGLKAELSKATAPNATSGTLGPLEKMVIELTTDEDLPLSERLYLIRMLELFGAETSVDPLQELSGSSEPEVRDSAVRALSAIPGKAATQYLMSALQKSNEGERIRYIRALAYRGEKSAAPEIAKSLSSDNEALVYAAIIALVKINNPASIPPLKQSLNSAPEHVKSAIESAILDLGPDNATVKELLETGSNTAIRVSAFRQLVASDQSQAQKHVLQVMGDPQLPARDRLIGVAMEVGPAAMRNAIVGKLPSVEPGDQIVIISAIGEYGLSQYEPQLLQLLEEAPEELHTPLIDSLSRIGGDDSFDPVFDAFVADSRSQKMVAAVSRLRAPSADKKALATAKSGSDYTERINAMKILELRNAPGATDLLNSIAQSEKDPKVRQASFKSLEAIGNLDSTKILVEIALSGDKNAKSSLLSLKRLSTNFGAQDYLWREIYQPAINSASDESKGKLISILDGIACKKTLDYVKGLALDPDSQVKADAIRVLSRWPGIDAGEVWLDIAMSEKATPEDISKAETALKKILLINQWNYKKDQQKLAIKAVKRAPTPEFKRAILSAYENPDNRLKGHLKVILPQLKDDPDIGDETEALLNTL